MSGSMNVTDHEKLQADPDQLAAFYTENYNEYGPTARKIIDALCRRKKSLFIWPFMKMPKLERWYSETGRVVLVGDGAHALPPSSGQGVNQALEDVYFITLLLNSLGGANGRKDQSVTHSLLTQALTFWQEERQKRIDAIFEHTINTTNVARLPEAERQKVLVEGKVKETQSNDPEWLYQPHIEEKVEAWLKNRRSS